MRLPDHIHTHLFHFAVVSQIAIDLDLHIDRLSIDRRSETLGNERATVRFWAFFLKYTCLL